MKAIIELDVPEWQIGQDVVIYFPDTMMKHGKCEAKKVYPKPEKLLPCICGCKRREHWYGPLNSENARVLRCYRCGLEASGRNEIEVHKKWNELIVEISKKS